jgi:hypothetical protein
MLDASREGFGKGDGICDPGRRLTAPVRLIAWLEPIDTGGTSDRIGLGRVFQIGHPASVHLLGNRALMPDVTVTAALVEGGEEPLHVLRAPGGDGQPRPVISAGVDVGRCLPGADIR